MSGNITHIESNNNNINTSNNISKINNDNSVDFSDNPGTCIPVS
jgi:hypothetical protein